MTVSRKIKVYRVEHRYTGVGPYRTGNGIAEDMNEAHKRLKTIRHVMPWHDGIETMTYDDVCGFVTREKLDIWFHGWKKKLKQFGFCIAVYEVPFEDVKFGRVQCVFERLDLEPIDKLSLLR